ncbi:hypothetical protein [Azospirillum brasilense]|uniref:Uncharacterized protein n=1 Tax=Azospirillum brasilense TaxID=192 RepID=A0A235H590_AZOBR|nr:hypothetical protein [Azospirillum brasilense]OYD80922.1 hypothetical protein CHT98_28395 [Azospirillum brasilense]
MSELRINSDVAERVLGHVIAGVVGIYDRHAYLDEKRDALERWAVRGAEIVGALSDAAAEEARLLDEMLS